MEVFEDLDLGYGIVMFSLGCFILYNLEDFNKIFIFLFV